MQKSANVSQMSFSKPLDILLETTLNYKKKFHLETEVLWLDGFAENEPSSIDISDSPIKICETIQRYQMVLLLH